MSDKVASPERFEQSSFREVERKYRPVYPEQLQQFREQSRPIEQFYLSSPNEPFSLRFREELDEADNLIYTAALKDRGVMSRDGLDRLEIETRISPELYEYYKSPGLPTLKKLRTTVDNYIAIDYYEDGHIQIESENPMSWKQFCECWGDDFADITEDPVSSNELRAYQTFGEVHPDAELSLDEIVCEILSQLEKSKTSIVRICGRSGSGKSTIARQVQQLLNKLTIPSDVISSDDYNRGSSWLRDYNTDCVWTEWDHPIVYDTETMAEDIQKLYNGQPRPRRIFDFITQEPSSNGEIEPVPVLIIEGIYALSSDLDCLDTIKYEVPTPLATCIGRRILRDITERPNFSDPSASLKYILEQAEPMYRQQIAK